MASDPHIHYIPPIRPYPPNNSVSRDSFLTPLVIFGYVLMSIFIVTQFIFWVYVVVAYRNLRMKMIEKGRLIQAIPFVAIATIGQPVSQPQMSYFTAQQQQQQMAAYSSGKDLPPPYTQ